MKVDFDLYLGVQVWPSHSSEGALWSDYCVWSLVLSDQEKVFGEAEKGYGREECYCGKGKKRGLKNKV